MPCQANGILASCRASQRMCRLSECYRPSSRPRRGSGCSKRGSNSRWRKFVSANDRKRRCGRTTGLNRETQLALDDLLAKKMSAVSGPPTQAGPRLAPFAQAHASTAAVLRNKFYTGSFECFTNGNEVAAMWYARSSFEIHNRSARNTCRFCQFSLAPAEHRSGASALLHGNLAHQLKSVFLFDFGANVSLND